MKWYALILLTLIVPHIVAGATVKTESSGFTRGSLDHIFTYDSMDAGTTVSGILPNDFITIEYQDGDRTSEYRLFFTRQSNDEWQFDEWTGERRLTIKLGGMYEIDLDDDGEIDLIMTYEEQQLKKGVFTFTPAKPECQIDIDCTEEPHGECVEGNCVYPEPECAEDADCAPFESCAEGLCLMKEGACRDASDCEVSEACTENRCVAIPDCTTDDECADGEVCEAGVCILAPTPPTWMPEEPKEPVPPPAPEPRSGGTIFWSLIILLVVILISAFFAFRTPQSLRRQSGTKQAAPKKMQSGKPKPEGSNTSTEQKPGPEPPKEPEPIKKKSDEVLKPPIGESQKHKIISRAPRKR